MCVVVYTTEKFVFKVLQVRYVSSHKRYDDRVSQSGIHAGACVMITAERHSSYICILSGFKQQFAGFTGKHPPVLANVDNKHLFCV